MRRYFKIYVLSMLCMIVQSCSDDSFEEPFDVVDEIQNDLVLNEEGQYVANEINSHILDEICVTSRSNGKSYPDYYGGSYIEKNGDLTIFISGDSIRGVDQIKRITSNPIVKFRRCEFAYQELLDVLNNITENLKNAPYLVSGNVTAAGINCADNSVEVFLADIAENRILAFKDMYSHPSISFHKMGGIDLEATSISPGYKLCLTTSTTDNNYGSFGFRARDKSNPKVVGFVTAGHVIDAEDYCFYNQKTYGKCTKSYPDGPKADAAFVVPDNASITYELTNKINGDASSILSVETKQPGPGTYVNLWGASSGHTGGYIKDIKYILYDKNNNPKITDLVSAAYTSAGGDSGGIVYTYISSSNTRYTVGIHLGHDKDNNLAIYSKADNVLSLLGVERY